MKIVFFYAEKFVLGIWGLNVIELFSIVDIKLLESVDANIKTVLAILGAIYLILQIPFKVIDLFRGKKMKDFELKIKEEEYRRKVKNRQDLMRASEELEKYDKNED